MFRRFLVLFIIFFSFFTSTFAYTNDEIKIYYQNFYNLVDKKFSTENEKINVLKKLENKLSILLFKTKNSNNVKILTELKRLNSLKIISFNSENTTNIEKNDEKIVENLVSTKKYTYNDLEKIFTNVYDVKSPFFIENWEYFSYRFNKYLVFDWVDSLYWRDLIYNKINNKTTLFIKDGWKYYFSNDFSKVRIIWEDLIKNISNKDEVLKYLLDDTKYSAINYDEYFKQINVITNELIKWKNTDDEKILAIYKWVIDNVNYYTNYKDWNTRIFSWIFTFTDGEWVCDWYTKLFLYMLSLAWISDVEVIRWFAYDNTDFPDFWHAWVRIWEYYYDPTFDDPLWSDNSKREYLYYKLPKELLYVNRFEWIKIIDNLDKVSLEDRKKLVLKNMYALYEKYKDYTLMKNIKNRIYLWLSYDESLTLDKLKDKMWYYKVVNFTLYDTNWYSKDISSLKYYKITQDVLDVLLLDKNIDVSKMYLLEWSDSNWTEYRLAYDLEFR